MPAANWPVRFSYDAIRIPLYLSLINAQQHSMENFRHFWEGYTRNDTPAWGDVSDKERASYPMSGGILAVRDLTMDDYSPLETSLRSGGRLLFAHITYVVIICVFVEDALRNVRAR